MDVEQSTELTGTNRSCGLVISLRQTSELAPRIGFARRGTAASKCASSASTHNRMLPIDKDNQKRPENPKVSGGDFEEATPDPIPNSEVKLFGADGTAREAVWESRTLPGFTTAMANSHS